MSELAPFFLSFPYALIGPQQLADCRSRSLQETNLLLTVTSNDRSVSIARFLLTFKVLLLTGLFAFIVYVCLSLCLEQCDPVAYLSSSNLWV